MSDLRRQSRGRSAALVWAATLVTAAALGAGCAKVPKTRYGVNEVRIEGTKKMSDDALEGCLGTRERPHVTATFGVETAGACGEPPFDADPPRLRLWAWPWTDWPLFDRIVLEQDLLRIDRWFEARGFHHAEVTDVQVSIVPTKRLSERRLGSSHNTSSAKPGPRVR
jgi:outer membrane protein assembly factor BamA